MYIMTHGESVKGGGLTQKGRDEVTKVISKIKESQNLQNVRRNYFTDIVTSDLRCCIETAEIAANILNVGIENTPFYKDVPQYISEEDFRIKVIVSMLLRGHQKNESETEFYERVRILLSNRIINKIGNLYYSIEREGIPSPLLMYDDNRWRKHLVVADASIINAIYRHYCSYNPELMALAEQQALVQGDALLYEATQAREEYWDDKGRVKYFHTGTIRKCDHRDF